LIDSIPSNPFKAKSKRKPEMEMSENLHIMIDLETLGTTADAVILSVGAVRFDLDIGVVSDGIAAPANFFYQAINVGQQEGRTISTDTLCWWMGQSEQAREVFSDPDRKPLFWALDELRDWINPQPDAMPTAWSNGADFDLPMLVHAYDKLGINLPWQPYAGRCYRTYKNLPGARAIKVERQGLHHNALDDAIFQAQHLCAIHKALFGGTP
jgi:hypothetical protein